MKTYNIPHFDLKCCIIFGLSMATTLVAQSTFVFQNYYPSAAVDAPVFDADGNRLTGSNYVAVLYGGPSSDALGIATHGGQAMAPVTFTYTPGGQTGYFRDPLYVEIPSVVGGGFAWLQVRAWDIRLGQTFDQVRSLGMGGYGESGVFYKLGGSQDGGVPSPAEPLAGLQSFSLLPVPEPSTWILFLAGVGFVGLNFLRRNQE